MAMARAIARARTREIYIAKPNDKNIIHLAP